MAKIGVVTVSDTRTRDTDRSGPAVIEALRALGYDDFATRLVPDETAAIRRAIRELAGTCSAVFTAGGTGFGPRDLTPEATADVLDRRADNLSELIRLRGLDHTPFSHLSRGIAGVLGNCLVVNLPGSPAGARQGVEAVAPLLGPILTGLAGEPCPVAEPGAC
ncbi:MAG: MogA/MoaB family molybdenum cofactor biosynthesis protein [Fimbriimonas ginsengisoli]|uniref:MogA/MoaB family molybdenum cofactor biosynthesis protein n=1 Tax=Fimbriimonas ginsengisoli TaxID=1005039 RepID=A0A931PVB4_FIMGI|nr:MogA/MoaB family molybdenum cofactor biosynthesis protein [Fimbriimonas ginsengisoli]MBI3721693.1 MogA/MoaB family molybdenum cofactor biosynthesis protein [Fimbriimonas ginsengisoli]